MSLDGNGNLYFANPVTFYNYSSALNPLFTNSHGMVDGYAFQASFGNPRGISFNSPQLLISDPGFYAIRRMNQSGLQNISVNFFFQKRITEQKIFRLCFNDCWKRNTRNQWWSRKFGSILWSNKHHYGFGPKHLCRWLLRNKKNQLDRFECIRENEKNNKKNNNKHKHTFSLKQRVRFNFCWTHHNMLSSRWKFERRKV